jgi:hypothetical protein
MVRILYVLFGVQRTPPTIKIQILLTWKLGVSFVKNLIQFVFTAVCKRYGRAILELFGTEIFDVFI